MVSDDEGGNDNGGSGTETTTETYKVNHGLDNGNYVLDPTNLKSSYAVGETVILPIKTLDYKTPTELYLVKVHIISGETEINKEVIYNKENHTVSFTMPDNDVMVRADFYDVVFNGRGENDNKSYPSTVATNKDTDDSDFDVGLCFNEGVFDNLEYIDSKYVFRVANKSKITKDGWSDDFGNYGGYYDFKITTNINIETGIRFVRCAIVDKTVFKSNENDQININFVN